MKDCYGRCTTSSSPKTGSCGFTISMALKPPPSPTMASRLFAKLSRIRSIAPVNLKTSVGAQRMLTAQMTLAENDDVIQTFSADRTDKTLSVRVLPRRSRRSDDLRDPHRSNAMTQCRTIGFVSVPQQIARCSVPGKGLGHLARKPVLRGIWRDLKVDNPSAIKI